MVLRNENNIYHLVQCHFNININRLLGGTKFSQNISSCTDTCCFYKPKRTINLNFDFLFWQSSNFVKKKSSPLILKSFQFLIYRRIFLIEGTFSKLNYRKIDMERNYVNKRQKKRQLSTAFKNAFVRGVSHKFLEKLD